MLIESVLPRAPFFPPFFPRLYTVQRSLLIAPRRKSTTSGRLSFAQRMVHRGRYPRVSAKVAGNRYAVMANFLPGLASSYDSKKRSSIMLRNVINGIPPPAARYLFRGTQSRSGYEPRLSDPLIHYRATLVKQREERAVNGMKKPRGEKKEAKVAGERREKVVQTGSFSSCAVAFDGLAYRLSWHSLSRGHLHSADAEPAPFPFQPPRPFSLSPGDFQVCRACLSQICRVDSRAPPPSDRYLDY